MIQTFPAIQVEPMYSRIKPYLATIKERYCLSKVGTSKNTQHIVIDLKGSGFTYQVGDSLGVFPLNDPQLVDVTLQAMKAVGDEWVIDRSGVEVPWIDFLISHANLTEISRKFLLEITQRQTNPHKKLFLEELHLTENKERLKEYLANHYVWDLLVAHEEISFTPQELCSLLMPLLPRLYSISSSQKVVGEEVHLTVALLKYETNGHARKGVCTHYLCELTRVGQTLIPVFVQPHHGFTLPESSVDDIIMIGPGTGVAPFRAFMQERAASSSTGKNWLFFGEWNRETDFFYSGEWEDLVALGKLKLSVAFSRDQAEKIYVQHRMLENGHELYQWIAAGAYVYVCGDMHRMARDVEATLLQIFEEHGNMSAIEAKNYLKMLRHEKRYRRDVY